MGKRKSVASAGDGVRKLRLVLPALGEQGPVPVYLATRLQPDDQAVSRAIQRSEKRVQINGQLVRELQKGHLTCRQALLYEWRVMLQATQQLTEAQLLPFRRA